MIELQIIIIVLQIGIIYASYKVHQHAKRSCVLAEKLLNKE